MFNLNNFKLSRIFTLIITIFSIGFITYGAWSFNTLNELKVNGNLYKRIIQNKNLVADILPPPEYIIESYLTVLQLENEKDKAEQHRLIDNLNSLKKEFENRHLYWSKVNLDSELYRPFLKQSYEPATLFYDITFTRYIPAIKKNDQQAIQSSLVELNQAYQLHRQAIDKLVKLADMKTSIIESTAQTQIQFDIFLMIFILAASMLCGVGIAAIAKRSVLEKLGADPNVLSNASKEIAEGKFDAQLPVSPNDKSSVFYQIDQMRRQLRKVIDLERSEERAKTHQATIFAAHHYLNNALNNFQLVLIEIENNHHINNELLQKVQDSIFKIAYEMREFGQLENPTKENVEKFIKDRL
jgi:methyl-accepting chemotaxis protein